jgi:hypothetical protein
MSLHLYETVWDLVSKTIRSDIYDVIHTEVLDRVHHKVYDNRFKIFNSVKQREQRFLLSDQLREYEFKT